MKIFPNKKINKFLLKYFTKTLKNVSNKNELIKKKRTIIKRQYYKSLFIE